MKYFLARTASKLYAATTSGVTGNLEIFQTLSEIIYYFEILWIRPAVDLSRV